MYNGRIILNNYSKGSFGNIFTDSESIIYKVTKISEKGLLIVSNINEMIFFNKLKVIKKLCSSEHNENIKTDDKKPDDIKSPNIKSPDIKSPDIKSPDIKSPDIKSPDIKSPDYISLDNIKSPDYISLDDIKSPDVISFSEIISCPDLVYYDKSSYKSLLDEKIFIQAISSKYYNYETLQKKFIFSDNIICNDYTTYLNKNFDKYLLVNILPKYQLNLSKFINKYHVYVINNFEQMAKKLLKSLALLHHNDFLHGDLKSVNILINDSNDLCLTDFGAIKIINFNKYHLSCTISSRCPEDLNYEYLGNSEYSNSNFKSDIWSLGLIFAEMILGYNPILKVYEQIEKTGANSIILENKLLAYYKTINYVDILKLVKINPIKMHLNEKLYEYINVIEQMLKIEPSQRLSSIEEVYEKLFGEKIEYNFMIKYNYDYKKFNKNNNFDVLLNIRKKYYKNILLVCDKLNILFVCPSVIDILDRLFIKILNSLNNLVEFRDSEFNLIFAIIVILVSGIMNQCHHSYREILTIFNLKYEIQNISNFNNNLLEILEIMNYDIFRPFNIFYCWYLMEYNNCNCVKHTQNSQNTLKTQDTLNTQYKNDNRVIHSKEGKKKLLFILNEIIENEIIGISPEYYYAKL